MKVKICRIDKDLPLPEYHTKGAVAFDLIAREDTNVPPKEIILIPSNNIIKTPPGFALVLAPRSSMPKKTGLSFPHSIGIIDQDYCGEGDEMLLQFYNFSASPVIVERGERLGQAAFVRIDQAEWEEVEQMNKNNRGGFGSTG